MSTPGTVARIAALWLTALIGLAPPVWAQSLLSGPSESPVIRIDTGQHTAPINQLAIDSRGRFIATASDDKTVRLWDPVDGSLIDTLRVPVGDGLEGALYTVAISPDGRALVAAGYTGPSWDGAACLYLFDLEKRKMKGRLPNLPAVVTHLAYAPDGKAIVAGLFGGGGVRVWDSNTGKPITQDDAYGDSVSSLAFDGQGRLAVVAADGSLRLYGPDFALLKTVRLPGGKKPHSVSFSPEGDLIAVGYEDSLRVDVLSSKDMKLAYSPSVAGLKKGTLGSVAWTGRGDGASLAAGGSVLDKTDGFVVRRWSKGGRGPAQDIVVARDTIMDLEGTASGDILFASAEPAWGRIDAGGTVALVRRGHLSDFHNVYAGRFAVSADGMVVEFGTARGGKHPVRFDMKRQTLSAAGGPGPSLAAPLMEHKSVRVEGWRNTPTPRLAGRTLPLAKGESSLSLAIAHDGGRVLIGGDYNLHLFDAKGTGVKSVAVPGAAWGVNIAANGKVAVAALGDGSVRWYDLTPGHELDELGAVFLHDGGKTWVSWIPEGFFTHSPSGGERLIGYHVNRGKGKPPEFVSIEQTYQTYYSPRLVGLKLQGDPTGELAQRMAEFGKAGLALTAKPVPKVEWVEYCPLAAGGTVTKCLPVTTAIATRDYKRTPAKPQDKGPDKAAGEDTAAPDQAPVFIGDLPPGTGAVRLRFRATDQGGGIGGIDVLQNDKIAATTRDYRRNAPLTLPKDGLFERDITVQSGLNTARLKVFEASNGRYELSSPIGFQVAAAPMPALASATGASPAGTVSRSSAEGPPKPRLFVIAAGINEYQNARLSFPVPDAEAFLTTLTRRPSSHYTGGVIAAPFLKDEKVTLATLSAAFDQIAAQKPGPDDRVVLYLAGHGVYDPKEGGYVFITHDADKAAVTTQRPLSELGFGQAAFLANMAKVSGAGSIMMLLDTCHSGAGGSSLVRYDPGTNADGQDEGIGKIRQSLGEKVLVLSAASGDEKAADVYRGVIAKEYTNQHGIFAVAVLRGLQGESGWVADSSGNVKAAKFGMYVAESMETLVKENNELLEKKGARPNPQKSDFRANTNLNDVFYLTQIATKR